MKILVQGTKGGAKIFYPQTTPDEFYTFAGDVRDINGAGGVGERAYSIALTADGCIFSKYLGVRDVQRSWEGNVSFSLFLSNRQSMPGEKIQALLDELLSTYADRYIVDDNIDIVHEDWSFIEEITSRYESYIKSVSGNELDMAEYANGIPAFLFYDGNDELTKYFEFPYQKEYLPYKQVFFLDKEEQNNTRNLLNALRHNPDANLTGKVDLENPRLTLTNFDTNGKGGVRITLKANGRYCQNRSKFFRKDDLELTYSKPGYRDIFVTGRLSDPMSEINDYLKIVDGNKVDVKNSVELDAEIIEITLRITDETGNVFTPENNNVNVRAYQSKDTSSEKKILSLKVTFIGEETLKWWVVEASSENKKGYEEFKPSDIWNGGPIEIIMKENKPEPVRDIGPNSHDQGKGRQNYRKYYISIDSKKGTSNSPSEKEVHLYPPFSCTPHKGYIFTGWKPIEERKKVRDTEYSGYYEAQFKELWWHKVPGGRFTVTIAAAIVLAGVITLACWWYLNAQDKNDQYNDLVAQIDKILDEYDEQPESVSMEALEKLLDEWNGLKPDSTKDQDLWNTWKGKMECLQIAIDDLKKSEEDAAAADLQWNNIKDSKNSDDFIDYLNRLNTLGIDNHREEANAALKDINDWETAINSNSAQAYNNYLSTHPDGRFADDARSKIKTLTRERVGNNDSSGKSTPNPTTTTKNNINESYITTFWDYVYNNKSTTYFNELFKEWNKALEGNSDYGVVQEQKQYKTFYSKYISPREDKTDKNGIKYYARTKYFDKIPVDQRQKAASSKNLTQLEELVNKQIDE